MKHIHRARAALISAILGLAAPTGTALAQNAAD